MKDDVLIVRHPDHPGGVVVGYCTVVSVTGAPIAIHTFERGHDAQAVRAAQCCANRHPESYVTREGGIVHMSRPTKHNVRAGQWDGPVGTTVTVRGAGGCYVQEDK
jgi:hypothetical protein